MDYRKRNLGDKSHLLFINDLEEKSAYEPNEDQLLNQLASIIADIYLEEVINDNFKKTEPKQESLFLRSIIPFY